MPAAAACATGASCAASSRAAARCSRGSCFGSAPNDLTGGFKAWRRAALETIDWGRVHSGGYVFQIETTYLASRAGATVAEVPIVFKDREVGTSKMSKSIIVEALVVVLQLRWDELRGRGPDARMSANEPPSPDGIDP